MAHSRLRVLITEPIPQKAIQHLNEHFDVTIGSKGEFNTEASLIEVIDKYDALLSMLSTPVTKNVLRKGKKLQIVANFAVGYNNIDVNSANNLNIKVANTPDVLTEACGDFAMGLLMAVSRKFNDAEQYLRQGKFKGWEPLGFLGMELRGKTLGIVGMGRIGQAFAHRAKCFGMNIAYHNRKPVDKDIHNQLDAKYVSSVLKLAKQSDVLSLNCPLTPETHHLINEDVFLKMPNHAILINVSRGPVVDEEALAKALTNGEIAGAGVDVFEEEPKVHPLLLKAPNCTMLPHISSATIETREAIGMLAANTIIKVLNKAPITDIKNLV